MKFVLIRLTAAWYTNETREDGQLICKSHRIIGILLLIRVISWNVGRCIEGMLCIIM